MTEKDIPTFDFLDEGESPPQQLKGEGLSTETIDLAALLTNDAYASGSFDLSSVGSTSFGRLLDALPMPVLLIDQWYSVGFVNQSFSKISADYQELRGVPFLDLVPRPADSGRAHALVEKTKSLLEKVFSTRRPHVAEAILEIHKKRVWARLHLRTVRIGRDRHVLVLIEDRTHEKRQLELNRRHEMESSRLHGDLAGRFQEINSQLSETTDRLNRETAEHLRTQRDLRVEKQKFRILWEETPLAAALVASTGTFQQITPGFTEMFGYSLGDVPSMVLWIVQAWSDDASLRWTGVDWLDTLSRSPENRAASAAARVTCKDGTTSEVRLTGAKLDDGRYFITCRNREPLLQVGTG